MTTITDQILQLALNELEAEPNGIRYSQLVRRIREKNSNFKINTIHGTIWNLQERRNEDVYKPSRGLFRLVKYKEPDSDNLRADLVEKPARRIWEEEFYEPFADWLVNDIEECTKAIALGGSRFGPKWGTPDVLGKRESKRSDIIQAPTEIIAAEIKPDVSQLVTAFGQACAYCLFSHKSYLVIPDKSPDDEIARIDSLCQIFGIGLILFDADCPESPNFTIRCRARFQQPDLFYANRYLTTVESDLFS
jgi:hypothetical protein